MDGAICSLKLNQQVAVSPTKDSFITANVVEERFTVTDVDLSESCAPRGRSKAIHCYKVG